MKQRAGRFIDPLSDFGFKHLFGNEPNKDILIDFLNQLFKGEKEIRDVAYSPTEHGGDNEDTKKVFFDLVCTGQNGEQFLIEMQRGNQHNFKDRAVFYTSRLINDQLPRGRKNWNTGLKEVYLIGILEFNLKNSNPDQYLHNVALTDLDTGEHFYKKLGYKFLELPNFVKTEAQLETDLDRWLYLLKHMSSMDNVPSVLNKQVFQKIFKIAELSNLTKEEKDMYDSGLKAKWDYENTIAYAKDMAKEEGLEKGMEIGEHKKALEVALKMKQLNVSADQISKLTELPVAEIEAL